LRRGTGDRIGAEIEADSFGLHDRDPIDLAASAIEMDRPSDYRSELTDYGDMGSPMTPSISDRRLVTLARRRSDHGAHSVAHWTSPQDFVAGIAIRLQGMCFRISRS
jgi:hypothetical protein